MLRKTTVAVIGLAASSFALAGTMGPVCTPGNVTVACEPNRWDLGVQALYLKAIYGPEKGLPIILTPSNSALLDTEWSWGFKADGSYHFNVGNDVTVDWTHYSSTNSLKGFLGTVSMPGTPFAISDTFQVANENRLDQVNLVLGQHVDLSKASKMRFYGGLQYANLQINVTNYYDPLLDLPEELEPFSLINSFSNADFKGFGPVVGMDYAFAITNELSLTANGAGSILYGTSRFNSGNVAQSVGLVYFPLYSAVKKIVPTVEAKLGLNYAYNLAQGVINLEAGYQVTNYFTPLNTASLVRFNTTSSYGYGLYGPYVGAKYLGSA